MSRLENTPGIGVPAISRGHLDGADIVIVGNGIAGLTAALEARRHAPDKRIVIISDQIHPTINTPALKQFAIGKLERDQLLAYPAGTERAERIHVVTARVEYIHAREKFVELDGRRGFGYNQLLLATGSTPNGLPAHLPGRYFDGVLTLHRLQDYLDLRRRLYEVHEAVVIGGGAHAIETVMGLLYMGTRVHWLIRSETFMPRVLDAQASEMVLDRVRRAGGVISTQTEVVGVVGRVGVVAGVITNHQELIPCQMVLVCTGTQPVSALAELCELPIQHDHGILVNDQLRTSVPDIYAAGDVAAIKNPQSGKHETRAQWYAAVLQGRIAGSMMVGRENLQGFGVQWHATHLGELSMLTVGSPLAQGEGIEQVVDTSQGGYRRLALVDDRLVGYLSLGHTQPDSLAIKTIIDEGYPVRSILKRLLKGNFDARQYLSQLRSHAAQGLLLKSRGEPGSLKSNPASQVRLLPMGGSQPPTHTMSSTQPTPGQTRRTEPLPAGGMTPPAVEAIILDEEISPFTGNLPALAPVVEAGPIPPVPQTQPPRSRTTTRNLWSYSSREAEEERARELEGASRQDSLWSYSRSAGSGDRRR